MQGRQLDRDAGIGADIIRPRRPPDGRYRLRIGAMVADRVIFGPGGLAQHVVGIGVAASFHGTGLAHGLANVAPQDELRAHFAHRAPHRGADHRLAQTSHHAPKDADDAVALLTVQHTPGQHQCPGRGVNHHRPGVADMRAPVVRRDLVLYQIVDGFVVRDTQQGLCEAHQRDALLGREPVFRQETLHHTGVRRGSHVADQSRRSL